MLEIYKKWPKLAEDMITQTDQFFTPSIKSLISGSTKILICGMGGSALPGLVLKDWLAGSLKIPIQLCRTYNIPAWVDRGTLVFAVSYSGDTEETLSACKEAYEKGARIIIISSGGALEKFALENNLPFIKVPEGFPPRASFPLLFFPLAVVMNRAGLVSKQKEIEGAVEVMKAVDFKQAEKVAQQIQFPLALYSEFESITFRAKSQINENAKALVYWGDFPELCHNELEGWEHPEPAPKTVLMFRSMAETPKMKTRIEATKKIAFSAAKVIEVWSPQEASLLNLLYLLLFGDLISIYLAGKRGVDPKPVNFVVKLKESIKEVKKEEKV